MNNIAVITTFGTLHFDLYAREMIQSFAKNWPANIPLLIALDDDKIISEVQKLTRPQDAIMIGWTPEHKDFVERNKDKDDPQNYRKQAVRFCHKVFAIKNALNAIEGAKKDNLPVPRYLIWCDADVHFTHPVTENDLKACLPKEGDAVAYLGRKDWPHSECGWITFDLEHGGIDVINVWLQQYLSNAIFKEEQWHDSWIFDRIECKKTNLTENKPGMEIWPHSPMAKFSVHHKGPVAKQNLQPEQQMVGQRMGNIVIQTQNSIPHDVICNQVLENQKLIKNWIEKCIPTDEKIIVVSAGPMLVAENVLKDWKGEKIVAVKHALTPLKEAGITPWACILLDPRPHVADFVKDADPNILWFVASQVHPSVTRNLLARGCQIWGYHATVGAGEHIHSADQPGAIVHGGSATATRGLYLLKHLGFSNMKLYGYDLCFPDRPDMKALDDRGQPKYLELSLNPRYSYFTQKRMYWTEPQLMAQVQEMEMLLNSGHFHIEADGDGIIPFLVKSRDIADLRETRLRGKIKPKSYRKLLKWKEKSYLTRFLSRLHRSR